MNNSFFSKFGPKEPKFFVYLKQVSEVLLTATDLLQDSLKSQTREERYAYFKKIKEQERLGDTISNKIFEELSSSFITPFDREDVHLLADCLDDVLDGINRCAKRIAIYNPTRNNEFEATMGEFVKKGVVNIDKAMDELQQIRKNAGQLKEHCTALHNIENEADDVYETAIINLFAEEKDSIELIKVKEILSELESVTDATERVGKVLRTIIVKYA